MTAGKAWPSELRTYEDRRTGVVVRQLTNYPAHSHHFYFTHSGWYANESKLLVASDRENKTDLFSIDLQTYAITQLTDLTPLPLPREVEFLRACTNPVRDEAYFWYGYELVALDLSTLAQRPLYRMPDGYDVSMISCSADGRYVYCSISEDMSDKFRVDLLRGYVGFRETWAAMPHNQIVQVAVDGSGHKAVWEELLGGACEYLAAPPAFADLLPRRAMGRGRQPHLGIECRHGRGVADPSTRRGRGNGGT